MKHNWFEKGTWNAICDVCGIKRKSNQMRARWDGLMVCDPSVRHGCWEPRHPQEFPVKPRVEQAIPWSRPEQTDQQIQSGNGLSSGYPTLNCDVLNYIDIPASWFNTLTANTYTITKVHTKGTVSLQDGVTIVTLCEWDVE